MSLLIKHFYISNGNTNASYSFGSVSSLIGSGHYLRCDIKQSDMVVCIPVYVCAYENKVYQRVKSLYTTASICTFPLSKPICRGFALWRLWLYQLQSHSQHKLLQVLYNKLTVGDYYYNALHSNSIPWLIHMTTNNNRQLTAIIAPLLIDALQAVTYLLGRPTHT